MFGELFCDNSYLSAILDRQGLQVAAPVNLRNRKIEHFSQLLSQGFWSTLKIKNPKIVVMSPTATTQNSEQKEVMWQQYRLCLAVAEHQILGGKYFPTLGPESGKIWWLKEVHYLQKNTTANGLSCVARTPSGFFHNFGILLRPLELVPSSREHVVPMEWQVRSVLGDCVSKAKMISIQAPQCRQYALISDFLDLASLNIQEEAALATNWIKDCPEGLKLENIALANMTGPLVRSQPKNLTANVQFAVNKCKSLGSGKPIDPSRESIGNCNRLFVAYGRSSTSFLTEYVLPVLFVASRHPRWKFRHLCGQ